MPTTPRPGAPAPALDLTLLDGTPWRLADQTPEIFSMLVVYRSLHCPICRTFLQTLHGLHDGFAAAGYDVTVLSMDDGDRAARAQAEWGLDPMRMAHGLTEAQARDWGLYLSTARKDDEPALFAEPGLFLVTRDGTLWMADVANVPFVRPDLDGLLARAGMMAGHAEGPPRGMD